MNRFIVISGRSGGGKSTLLRELELRGHAVVPEPGRRIIAEEIQSGGSALPWTDMAAFARRAIAMTLVDRKRAAAAKGPVFFDRSLIDAAAALEHATGEPVLAQLGSAHPYHSKVFMAPPWPEIWQNDGDRRHALTDAVAEYERLCAAYSKLDYELVALPKVSVEERADFIAG